MAGEPRGDFAIKDLSNLNGHFASCVSDLGSILPMGQSNSCCSSYQSCPGGIVIVLFSHHLSRNILGYARRRPRHHGERDPRLDLSGIVPKIRRRAPLDVDGSRPIAYRHGLHPTDNIPTSNLICRFALARRQELTVRIYEIHPRPGSASRTRGFGIGEETGFRAAVCSAVSGQIPIIVCDHEAFEICCEGDLFAVINRGFVLLHAAVIEYIEAFRPFIHFHNLNTHGAGQVALWTEMWEIQMKTRRHVVHGLECPCADFGVA